MGCDELLCLSLSIYGWRGKRGEVHHSQEIEAWSSNKKRYNFIGFTNFDTKTECAMQLILWSSPLPTEVPFRYRIGGILVDGSRMAMVSIPNPN